jgi:hypothetical protein
VVSTAILNSITALSNCQERERKHGHCHLCRPHPPTGKIGVEYFDSTIYNPLHQMESRPEKIIEPAFDDRRLNEYAKSIIDNSSSNQKGNQLTVRINRGQWS